MVYKTKRCPSCHKAIQIMQPDRGPNYGSPLRVCPFCGKGYVDNDYVELALKDPRKSFRRRSIVGRTAMILLRGLIIWVILFPVSLFLSSSLNIEALDIDINDRAVIWLAVIAVAISTIIYFPTPKRMQRDSENLEKIWQESFRRLQNPFYVRDLQNASIFIPEELRVQLEKSSSTTEEKSAASTMATYKTSFDSNTTVSLKDNDENEMIPKDALLKLKELHDKGVLTDEEFQTKKRQILKI